MIGDLWVYLIEGNRMAKLAYRVSDKYQGKGFATEAIGCVVCFCFEHTELRRLWAEVDCRNIASWRALQKAGFTREGHIREGKMLSTWGDYYIYGLVKEGLNK